MPVVPSIGGRSVNIQQIGSPSLSMVAPDASGLSQGLNRVENAAIDYVQKERENADTAALLDADRKLNDWKTAAMFDPKSGVYTRKGQNALDITNQTLPGYDKHVEEVMGGLGNEQQKERFKIVAARQREALSNELNRYEYGERQTWYDEADKASLDGAATGASLYYNRPDQMAGYMNKGLAVIESQGQRKGLPAEAVAQEKLKFTSSVHLNTIDRLMTENPSEALARYTQTSSAMTPEDQQKVEKVLVQAMQKTQGEAIAYQLLSGANTDYRAYLPAQVNQESGGQQFDKNGKPLTSSAGAVGVMQVMPATGPEAAKLAGVAWDEERFKTDKAYNACLGEAYCREQFRKFQDPVLALAAYNAGPGRVQQTIDKVGDPRTGAVTHEQFLNALPKETQGYVSNIIKNTPQVSQTAEGADRYATALEAVQAMPAGPVRDAVEAKIKDFKTVADAQDKAVYEQAADVVKNQGIGSLSPEIYRTLSADNLLKLQKLDKNLREGVEPVTVPGKFDEILELPRDKLAGLSLERDVRPYLNNSDYKVAESAVLAARKGDGSVQGMAKAENDLLNETMSLAGVRIGTSEAARKTANIQKQVQFKASYQRMRDSWVKANGKEPSYDEAQQIANQLLIKVKLDGEWGDQAVWELTPEQRGKAYVERDDIDIDEISVADREETAAYLAERNIAPTKRTMTAAYADILAARGMRVK